MQHNTINTITINGIYYNKQLTGIDYYNVAKSGECMSVLL